MHLTETKYPFPLKVYLRMAGIQSGVPWTSGTDDNSTNLGTWNAAEEADAGGISLPINESDVTNLVSDLAGKSQALTATAVKTSAYTAQAGEFVPVDTTSGAVTVTLPTAPADKTRVAVKHVIQGGTNTVTYACAGSDVLNRAGGSTSGTLTLSSQAVSLQYTASTGIWYIVADDMPLSQLDTRYTGTSSPLRGKTSGDVGTGQKLSRETHRHPVVLACIGQTPIASGLYTAPGITNVTSTQTVGNGAGRVTACYIPNAVTLSQIGMEVTTIGDTGSKIRLGIYADDGSGYYPGALLVDAGQINGDSATYQELSISVAIDNQQIWVVGVGQSITTTSPTMRSVSGLTLALPKSGTPSGSIATAVAYYNWSGITGALPNPFPASVNSGAGGVAKVWVKAS